MVVQRRHGRGGGGGDNTTTTTTSNSSKSKWPGATAVVSKFFRFCFCGGVSPPPPQSPPLFHHRRVDPFLDDDENKPNHNNVIIPTDLHHNDDDDDFKPHSTTHPKGYNHLCAICLETLDYSASEAIFTAQCSHAFHFACISSNVRHGGVNCPICRAPWTHLPRNVNAQPLHAIHFDDPILQILDHSIATSRVHRRSCLRAARYDDDDPIEPTYYTPNHSRLHFSLSCEPPECLHRSIGPDELCASPPISEESASTSYLSVKLAHQPAIDLVLVASPNGPHLRLVKQAMALVVFTLRPIDRLAIVTYSSSAARVFPLKRMTSYGKRAALQVIDRLFYMGQADSIEGLKKGVKVLGDRQHENPHSCILHLSDNPTRSYHRFDKEVPIPIYRFRVGYCNGLGTINGFVMREFEEFLGRIIGDAVRDVQLRLVEDDRIVVSLGELRGGEERRIPLRMIEPERLCVEYSYVEGGVDERIQTGEIVVCSGYNRETSDCGDSVDRTSNAGNWDYHDPFMARRWAKHLHGCRY